jgi:uncharacterized repeat protein (TIGR01451 family)
VSLLVGSALAGGARAQPGAAITPTPGAGAPRVIATSRPVNEVEQAKPAAVLPGHTAETDLPPVPRVSNADNRAPAPEALRLVGNGPTRAAAPPGVCLAVERVAPAQVMAGKPLIYEIVIRNVGAAEARWVRVEELLPAGAVVTATEPRAEVHGTALTWEVGALAPGAESRLHVTIQPPADGDVSATATVTSAVTSTLHARVVRSGLSLTVADPPRAQVGQKVTFPIRLANNTPAPLERLLLRARLSDGLQHPQGSLIEAVIPVLAAGEVKTVPLEVTAAKSGRATLSAKLTAGGTEQTADAAVEIAGAAAPAPVPPAVTGSPEVKPTPAPAHAPAPVLSPPPAALPPVTPPEKKATAAPEPLPALPPPPPPPDLTLPQARVFPPGSAGRPIASAGVPSVALDLADADAALEVGHETTYEIRVLNQGAVPTRDVLVKAVVPEEMALVRADGPGGQAAKVQGKEVAFGPLASLDGQGSAVYRVRVKALRPGDGRFQARLQCGDMARPLSQEVSTRVYTDEAPAGGGGQK